MTEQKTTIDRIILLCFIVLLLVLSIAAIIYMFKPAKSTNITFNVTGVTNATNSSIVSVHFECIQFCAKQYGQTSYAKECWEQCLTLGDYK